ncbi:MAG: hypothetical protein J7498_02850 [Sphingobium sp.]|nr:hypothetical protein [Sphingobium sp.]
MPPLDPVTLLELPRSPEPLPDDALVFARGAAQRVARSMPQTSDDDRTETRAPLSIAEGADLRALLERVQRSSRRREVLDQTTQARTRIVEQLSAGKAGAHPTLHLVGDQPLSSERTAVVNDQADETDLDRALEKALASALGTLRQISALSKR